MKISANPKRPDQFPVSPVSPRILQRKHRPYRSRNPTNERDLQNQTQDARQYPAPKQERQKRKENSDQSHLLENK